MQSQTNTQMLLTNEHKTKFAENLRKQAMRLKEDRDKHPEKYSAQTSSAFVNEICNLQLKLYNKRQEA